MSDINAPSIVAAAGLAPTSVTSAARSDAGNTNAWVALTSTSIYHVTSFVRSGAKQSEYHYPPLPNIAPPAVYIPCTVTYSM